MTDDINFIETDRLIQELKKRFDAFALCVVKSVNKNEDETAVYYHGGLAAALGLFRYGEIRVSKEIEESEPNEDWQESQL